MVRLIEEFRKGLHALDDEPRPVDSFEAVVCGHLFSAIEWSDGGITLVCLQPGCGATSAGPDIATAAPRLHHP